MQEPAPAGAAKEQANWLARLPLACAIASTLVLVIPVLRPGVQLFYRDTQRLYYPLKQYLTERITRGELPLWDPWTESGVSLLGQISPGIFHPFNLLYLFLPFDLAFKLNHLLALPMAAAATYWLARQLGAARWPAAAAAIIFSGCGYLVSTTASNLPYALGPASIPAACAGLLWLCERPSVKRAFIASMLLALCNYSGEPQSALFAAAIGSSCALGLSLGEPSLPLRVRWKKLLRTTGWIALWGAAALALSMPAVLPGGLRAHRSSRWSGLGEEEKQLFSLHPIRLAAFLIPLAFDDSVDEGAESHWPTPHWEYLSWTDRAAFADSIGLGAPALLLALFGFFTDRRARNLSLAALVFALGATGEALGVNAWLVHLLPGLGLFRYAEKLVAPASLLIALAAARGAEAALCSGKREATRLFALSSAVGLAIFAARTWLLRHGSGFEDFLRVHGRVHASAPAVEMERLLTDGLTISGTLCAVLALVALLRARATQLGSAAPALACACCFAAMMTYASDLLFTVRVSAFHEKPELARELERRAGPSEGRWRLLSISEGDSRGSDTMRATQADELSEVLAPQLDSLFHIEAAATYFSLPDAQYGAGFNSSIRNFGALFDVRFVSASLRRMDQATATQLGFTRLEHLWLRENPTRPRGFFVSRVFYTAAGEMLPMLADPRFDSAASAIIARDDSEKVGAVGDPGPLGMVDLKRVSPERFEVHTSAPARRLLLISEHFDPGWRASIDGKSAPLLIADAAAMAIPVPAGDHLVRLRFWPEGLTAGFWIATATLAGFALAGVLARSTRLVDRLTKRVTDHADVF